MANLPDEQRFSKPTPVNDVDLAFGGRMRDLLPAYDSLPEEYRRERDKFSPHVNRWFGLGIKVSEFKAKEGIDANAAWRHLREIMGSWDPKHEHKIAGVAWLMSQWFEEPKHVQ